MSDFELVIVGGGLASARAIKSFREAGGEGPIALVSKDSTLPYHRPPLSKKFLRGETHDEPLVEDGAFYRDHDVEVMLATTVSAVDVRSRSVQLDNDRLGYRKLLLASGAWPKRLQVPGADLENVFTLRRVVDSRAIREAAAGAERAAIVGAGFIGMEVSASLRSIGKDVSLIHLSRWLFEQLGAEPLSNELAALYRSKGVDLVLGHQVEAFHGDGRLEAVTTTNGRRVEADLAVIGIGVEPVTDFLEGSGVELDNGIVVNERFETNVPDVYAVGDVANFLDPLFGLADESNTGRTPTTRELRSGRCSPVPAGATTSCRPSSPRSSASPSGCSATRDATQRSSPADRSWTSSSTRSTATRRVR
ncbi:MAG TPA: NAD(P)/FAD-dependent oxidoreductase [Gaiellaceae bacterium]|nr:NAD(P)/FAD-dependent oxidoreductase [Gaiellaceae bacterium]